MLTPTLSEEICGSFFIFELFSRDNFTANKFQNDISVNYVIVKRFTKIHSSRTAYYNFDLKRLLSLFKIILKMIFRTIMKKMISTKMVITNFHGKLRKLSIMLFSKILLMIHIRKNPSN